MEPLIYLVCAVVVAIPATACICRHRLAHQKKVSLGAVAGGAIIAALIAYTGVLIYAGGASVFTVAFWNDAKQAPNCREVLLGLVGTAVVCAVPALGVVGYYQARQKHERHVG